MYKYRFGMRAFYQMQKNIRLPSSQFNNHGEFKDRPHFVASDEFFGTHVCHLWNFNDRAAFVVSTTKIPELFTLNSS